MLPMFATCTATPKDYRRRHHPLETQAFPNKLWNHHIGHKLLISCLLATPFYCIAVNHVLTMFISACAWPTSWKKKVERCSLHVGYQKHIHIFHDLVIISTTWTDSFYRRLHIWATLVGIDTFCLVVFHFCRHQWWRQNILARNTGKAARWG